MKVLLDMNIPPVWISRLQTDGLEVVHWQDKGPKNAPDGRILEWAKSNKHIILTLDLDFQQLLFATRVHGPSVVLLRVRDPLSPSLPAKVRRVFLENNSFLEQGCLIVLDENRSRIRRLPLTPDLL